MPSIEITAKSVEDARTTGAARLGVEPGAVNVTVLEETKGLFGKSQVRARVESPDAVEAPATPAAPVAKEAPAGRKKVERAPKAEAKPKAAEPKPEDTVPEPVVAAPVVEEAPKPARGRGRSKAAPKVEEAVAAPVEAPAAATEAPAAEEAREEAVATQEDGDRFVALIDELMEAAGLDVKAKVAGLQGRYVNVSLDGKDSSHLVGKHGEVLNALQYLVNILSNRRTGNGVRSSLECNDYRQRREQTLMKMAHKVAEQVIERREEAVLEALPAYERRIVHKVISEMDGVETYSEGEEPNRRVVIAPRG
ncbi:protein jag [bacterium]|nr:MAG: protein jag [bacterium]